MTNWFELPDSPRLNSVWRRLERLMRIGFGMPFPVLVSLGWKLAPGLLPIVISKGRSG
jgi:hypothetical protein